MRDVRIFRLALALVAFFVAVWFSHGSARAAPSCVVDSGLSIAFGNYDVYGPAVASTGTISGKCHKAMGTSMSIAITIDGGNNLQPGGNRAMACSSGQCVTSFPSDLLQYQLYTDAGRSAPWTANTVSVNTTCSGCNGNGQTAFNPVTIYAQIPVAVAGGVNDTAVGTYSDTLTVTLNF